MTEVLEQDTDDCEPITAKSNDTHQSKGKGKGTSKANIPSTGKKNSDQEPTKQKKAANLPIIGIPI